MKIKDLYSKYSDNRSLNFLLPFILKKELPYILAHPEHKIKAHELERIKRMLAKLKQAYPPQYITKEQYFYGLEFKVNQNVLIPRPETEILVESVLRDVKCQMSNVKCQIIDIGTGTGCIATALAVELNKLQITNPKSPAGTSGPMRDYKISAIDISRTTLNIARRNAKFHNVKDKITFHQGDLLTPILKRSIINDKSQRIVITANLPYLTPSQIRHSPTIQYEPRLALDGGRDGLEFYKRLLAQVQEALAVRHWLIDAIFLEIDHTQARSIQTLIKKILPNGKITIIPDLQGYERIVKIVCGV